MNQVVYFSPTNSTRMIAEYIASYLNIPINDLTSHINISKYDYSKIYEYTVICVPVYSQNIPLPMNEVIKKLQSKYFIIIATYGRMSPGNVLEEVSKYLNGKVIGGAYIPTKHTYKDGNYFNDFIKLNPLLDRINDNKTNEIIFPRLKKHLLASILPNFRSRVGVKIIRTNNCICCNLCNSVCPTNSIINGKINKNCIRCLSCYLNCPYNGLRVKYSSILKGYLKNDKFNKLIIY